MTISIRQVRPTTEVGNIKISPTAFQGEFEARKGVERAVGGAALTIAKDMQNLQFTTELADAQVSYDQQFRAFQASELTNPDHIGSTERFDKFHTDTTSAITTGMKNNRARRQADVYFSGLQSRRGTAVQADAFRQQAAEAQAKITPNLESYAQQFTDARTEDEQAEVMAAADTYLQLLHTGDPDDPNVPGNLLSSAQLVQRQEQWDTILEENVQTDIFIKARNEAMSFATVEDATTFIDGLSGAMDRAAREDLLAQVKRKFSARDAEQKQALDAQMVTDRQSILDRFIKEEYEDIDDFINASTLDPDEKLSWIEKSERRAEAINSDKEDPFLQTDSSTYFELYRKIQADPASVSEDDLSAVVGKGDTDGISIADYEKMLGMITDSDNPLNSAANIRSKASTGRMRTIEIREGVGEDFEEALEVENTYLQIDNEMDAFILEEKPTDEQIRVKTQQLLQPRAEAIVLGFMDELFLPKEGTIFGGKRAEKELAVLKEKRLEAFEEHPVFEDASEEQIEKAKEAFNLGFTLKQVIDALNEELLEEAG